MRCNVIVLIAGSKFSGSVWLPVRECSSADNISQYVCVINT